MESEPVTPKTRKSYSTGFKADIQRSVKNGSPIGLQAKINYLEPSMLYKWSLKSDLIFQAEAQNKLRIGEVASAKFPNLEACLLKFVTEARKNKICVNKKIVQDMALKFAANLEFPRSKFKAQCPGFEYFVLEIV